MEQTTQNTPVTPFTVVCYLFGSRQAIRAIASSRSATWLGLAWVLLAGLFREYDQEYLLLAPWYALIPLGASLLLSFVMWLAIWLAFPAGAIDEAANINADGIHPRSYRGMLNCFWMCAPMAALYAAPVERWMSEGRAAQFNMAFLGIVALWRVVIMIRAASVLFQVRFIAALFPVMWVSTTVVVFAMFQLRLPLLIVMGGIQLTETERVLQDVRAMTILIGVLSWPFWAAGSLGVAWRNYAVARRRPAETPSSEIPRASLHPANWVLFMLALVAISWAAAAFTQPIQQRCYEFERLASAGRYKEALKFAAGFSADAFPPHWDPPPRLEHREGGGKQEKFFEAFAVANEVSLPDWLRQRFDDKLLRVRGWGSAAASFWDQRTDPQLLAIAARIQAEPELLARIEDSEYQKSRGLRSVLTKVTKELLEREAAGVGSSLDQRRDVLAALNALLPESERIPLPPLEAIR